MRFQFCEVAGSVARSASTRKAEAAALPGLVFEPEERVGNQLLSERTPLPWHGDADRVPYVRPGPGQNGVLRDEGNAARLSVASSIEAVMQLTMKRCSQGLALGVSAFPPAIA